ncbi:MAG: hypothetical protein AB1758_34925, partial [Candidatus Eremiobacterota bacterium]
SNSGSSYRLITGMTANQPTVMGCLAITRADNGNITSTTPISGTVPALTPGPYELVVPQPTSPASGPGPADIGYTTTEWSFDLSEFLAPSDRIRVLLWRER